MKHDALISPAYLALQQEMHRTTSYGGRGERWAPALLSLMHAVAGHEPTTVLDYGAGKGAFRRFMTVAAPWIAVTEYDPAVPALSAMPAPAAWVYCSDVLEHIEPDRIDAVLQHMRSLTTRPALFLAIALVETAKKLPDGRGAHVLVRPRSWWLEKLVDHGWRVAELEGSNPNPAKHLLAYCARP